jgi:hypothetical protein
MAGAALMISETMIPASKRSTTQAAPWASAEKSVSAQAEVRRSTGGPPAGSERGMSLLFSNGDAGSVADTFPPALYLIV